MSARLSTGRPFACSGAMYAAVPRITPRSVRAGDRTVGELASAVALASSGASALARPKSSTFTAPSGVIFTLAGFRSRWTMPFSCAASSASAICRAIARASAQADALRAQAGARRDELSQRRARDQLHDEVVGPDVVERADVRMVEGGNRPRLALESVAEFSRRDFDRDVAAETGVASLVDLAHSAFAQLGHDLIGTERLADHRRVGGIRPRY